MPPLPLYTTIIFLLLFSGASTTSAATTLGVTYNTANSNLPPPERVASTLRSIQIPTVRILNPTASAVRAFAYTNISLLLSVPNSLLPSFAANRSAASLWLYNTVLPFHPRTKISLISVGSDALTSTSPLETVDPTTSLLPAIRNLHLSLIELGIKSIPVSTTFSFVSIMTTSFPPSSSEFQEPVYSLVIRPLLQFLEETNSSFLINLYPYNIYRIDSEIPIGYALFEEHPFNFRDDLITGVRYRNLFDMMVDAVVAAMAVSGQENIPVVVAETGWPSEAEARDTGNYAEMFLKGLVAHLKSGLGTPLRKEGVAEAYIYQLFDDDESVVNGTSDIASVSSRAGQQHWGIMYPNMTLKYNLDFSGSRGERLMDIGVGVIASLVSVLLLL
ncbi:hypothetical protein ACJIZ3_006063 [Penstemon smallii]|uniref:Uncharacterized protein n=1 Tax=Penstemon smallii TaxID=265156 RepID=A0ABD3S6S8_9LAMI